MRYRLSSKASSDLDSIVVYTLGTWGEAQADRYFGEMQDKFELLASMPRIGRLSGLGSGGRRFEQGSHVILYRETADGIFVQRVLHKRMLPSQ